MPVKVSAEQAASLYVERLQNARSRIETGVNAVTVSPTSKAADAQVKMLANLTAAVNSGKWAKNLRKVSLESWRNDFLTKGLDRIGTGAANAKPKMVTFYTELFKKQNELLGTIEKMPNTTLDQSIARMVAWTRGMAAFQY